MVNDNLRRLMVLLLLVLFQTLILNHIRILGCATPFLYIILPLQFPLGQPRWASLLWCFSAGLLIDMFSNTPGVASGSLTLIGLIQPYMLRLFVSKETEDTFVATLKSLGYMKYITYSATIVLIFCLTFYTLEAFSFLNATMWLMSWAGSAVFTQFLVIVNEKLKRK